MSAAAPPLARLEWPAEPGAGPAAAPVVLLHGFDGSASAWAGVAPRLAADRRVVAFDLPGHGGSPPHPASGPAKTAARAVLAELDRLGWSRAHLVGHSLGGAVAALAGLFAPVRVASLVLLAPGGFGPAIGIEPIRAVMDARDEASLRGALSAMGAPGWQAPGPVAQGILAERERFGPEGRQAVAAVFEQLFGGGGQGVLPLDALASTGLPVALVWGETDPVTPFAQMAGAPAAFARHGLPGIGHMPMLEAPDILSALVADLLRVGDAAASAGCRPHVFRVTPAGGGGPSIPFAGRSSIW